MTSRVSGLRAANCPACSKRPEQSRLTASEFFAAASTRLIPGVGGIGRDIVPHEDPDGDHAFLHLPVGDALGDGSIVRIDRLHEAEPVRVLCLDFENVARGDVVIEDHDIFGDAVNVAARLEALAEPGGICVSARVRGDAAGKLNLVFEDMGQQPLKNIARPLRVFALRPEGTAGLATAHVLPASPTQVPAVAPRLSIVVLPFTSLSNDPEQQYFADGITEDLTTDLSRIAHSFVISHNTAFTYRNKPIDTRQIGRELGVRYVLQGSVRRSGRQIRVSAQLIDAATDSLCGQNGSTATQPICSLCKTRSRAGSRTHSASS
jgi:TolB-like protein